MNEGETETEKGGSEWVDQYDAKSNKSCKNKNKKLIESSGVHEDTVEECTEV